MLAQVSSCFARQGTRFFSESALWPRLACPLCPPPPCLLRSATSSSSSSQGLLHCTAFGLMCCTRFVLSLLCIQASVAALPSKHSAYQSLPCTAQPRHAMATSTALKAFMQAPREQRVVALRSLGAEKMAQLEGELREARLTLFGPMPSSKASKATACGHSATTQALPCPTTSPQGGTHSRTA